MSEQKSEPTELQRATVDYDDDMTRLDHNNHVAQPDGPCPACGKLDCLDHAIRTRFDKAFLADTAQSDGVVEGLNCDLIAAPERIWMHVHADADCWCCYHFEQADDPRCLTEYIRAPTPDSIAEKARLAAQRILATVPVNNFREMQRLNLPAILIAIITTEFGAAGEQAENKS